MALQLWETIKEAILTYTGLSPATFFTLLALLFAVYYVISGLFATPDQHQRTRSFEEMEPLPPPVQLGEITEDELKQYDGADPKKPLLMAIKGQIYDVTQSRYSMFLLLLLLFFLFLFLIGGQVSSFWICNIHDKLWWVLKFFLFSFSQLSDLATEFLVLVLLVCEILLLLLSATLFFSYKGFFFLAFLGWALCKNKR